MEWLPYEFTGVRSPAEVEHDLLVIAGATDGLNEAHVSVDRDEDGGRITVLVDSVADLRAIAEAPPPLNQARVWHWNPSADRRPRDSDERRRPDRQRRR